MVAAAAQAHFAVRQKQGLLLHMMAAPPMRKMALATCTHHNSKRQQHVLLQLLRTLHQDTVQLLSHDVLYSLLRCREGRAL
jgi:hypothetical protein